MNKTDRPAETAERDEADLSTQAAKNDPTLIALSGSLLIIRICLFRSSMTFRCRLSCPFFILQQQEIVTKKLRDLPEFPRGHELGKSRVTAAQPNKENPNLAALVRHPFT